MREILFKGKRADNGEWAYGYYAHRPTAVCIGESNPSCIYVPACDPDDNSEFIEVLPETVGQYTGLTDKNGKKIFEGDILEGHFDEDFPENITLVEVIWKEYGFYTKGKSTEAELLDKFDGEIYEVIGNIYDSPELLEGSGK